MEELIVKAITGILHIVQTTREALAQDLAAIAKKIGDGELIADEAFCRAEHTRDETQAARDKLPK